MLCQRSVPRKLFLASLSLNKKVGGKGAKSVLVIDVIKNWTFCKNRDISVRNWNYRSFYKNLIKSTGNRSIYPTFLF